MGNCEVQLDHNELQQIELNIAKEFTSLCDKYKLTYFMIGGTLLGAIRHKGFIPWDDDMDFAMPRDDYERFIKLASKELPSYLSAINYRNTPGYQYYSVRIVDKRTKVIEERVGVGNKNRITNICIDVFPIDGSPNFWPVREIYYVRVLFHKAMMSMCHKDSLDKKRKRPLPERILIAVMDKLPIEKITTTYKQQCKIDKLLRKHKIKGSKYIGNIMGAYRTHEMVPAEYYGKGRFYTFEDTKFRGLSMYDEYLTHQYGNYMKLPSEEDRVRKTHFKVLEHCNEKTEE